MAKVNVKKLEEITSKAARYDLIAYMVKDKAYVSDYTLNAHIADDANVINLIAMFDPDFKAELDSMKKQAAEAKKEREAREKAEEEAKKAKEAEEEEA